MSRRSLRLHTSTSHYGDDSLLDSSLSRSVAYVRRDDNLLKSRRAHHSFSGSLGQTPRCASTSVLQAHNSTLNSCAPSDASLLSSLLDESSIQERTLVDSFWGLDEDGDIKDQTLRSQHSTVEAKTQTSTAQNGYACKDCSIISSSSVLQSAAEDQKSPSTASYPNTTLYCRDGRRHKPGNEKYYSSMSVKEVLQKERPKFNGVLCDDCKRKHTHPQEQESVGALWSPVDSTGKAASGSVLWLGNFFAQCLPMLSKLLFLVPFLLFLALWYWGPSGLLALLSSANTKASHHSPTAQTFTGDSKEGQTPAETNSQRVLASIEAERFTRLEDSLAQLWDRVAGGLLRQEEQHTEVLSLYNTLRVEFHKHTDRESMGKWIGDMLEERFSYLKKEVEKEAKHTQQHQEKQTRDMQSENTRLAEAEALLQTLARKTEELQRKQERPQKKRVSEAETTTPEADSEESDSSSSDVLLGEVKRLEEALESIRDDVQGLMGCKDRCEQLDVLQNSVSEQVEKEVKSLFYGSDKADELQLPESLLQWLSDQFVSTTELQASLRALESTILGNLSLQMEEGESPSKETFTRTVLQATEDAGLTEDHVQLIVDNALKLYSQDRTGLVDYALESGGGSIISTRCSESFETKTALMSLFGLPLWYFSQSPRAVIQPDVHPGNCWAFKGSSGFLVIGLSMKIVPTSFSMEHIPKSLSPTGNISSAPKEFSVYGLDDEQQEEGQLLGQFVYDDDGDSLQTFSVTEEVTRGFQIIEVRVLSNWGHLDYTCMYRFRVHGELADEADTQDII